MISRLKFFLLSLSYLGGLWLSDLLVQEHIGFKLGDLTDSGVCGASTLFSCKAAAASVYSNIFGLPIAAIGEAYYLTGLLLLISARLTQKSKWGESVSPLLGGAATISVIYSLFLGVVSALDLGFLCPLCMGLYAINLITFVLLWSMDGVGFGKWLTVLKTWTPWLTLLLMGASIVGTQAAYATRYSTQYKIVKKKKRAEREVKHYKVKRGQSPARGDAGPGVIIEFSDFECPFCRRFAAHLKRAQREAGEYPFQYVFKHYPLSTTCNPHVSRDMHPRACFAASVAICAEAQGKFWQMHDLLFANQKALEQEDLIKYAETLELDIAALNACVGSDETASRLQREIEEGHTFKVGGTPAFFINGWRFSGAVKSTKLNTLVKEYVYGVLPPKTEGPKSEPKPEGNQGGPDAKDEDIPEQN